MISRVADGTAVSNLAYATFSFLRIIDWCSTDECNRNNSEMSDLSRMTTKPKPLGYSGTTASLVIPGSQNKPFPPHSFLVSTLTLIIIPVAQLVTIIYFALYEVVHPRHSGKVSIDVRPVVRELAIST